MFWAKSMLLQIFLLLSSYTASLRGNNLLHSAAPGNKD